MSEDFVIVTSADEKVIKGQFVVTDVRREGYFFFWSFPSEDAANHAMEVFNNSKFDFVRRLV